MFQSAGINGIGMVAICQKQIQSEDGEVADTGVEKEFPSKTDGGDVVELPVLGFVTDGDDLKACCVDMRGNLRTTDTIPGFLQIVYREEGGVIDDDDWGDEEDEEDE